MSRNSPTKSAQSVQLPQVCGKCKALVTQFAVRPRANMSGICIQCKIVKKITEMSNNNFKTLFEAPGNDKLLYYNLMKKQNDLMEINTELSVIPMGLLDRPNRSVHKELYGTAQSIRHKSIELCNQWRKEWKDISEYFEGGSRQELNQSNVSTGIQDGNVTRDNGRTSGKEGECGTSGERLRVEERLKIEMVK